MAQRRPRPRARRQPRARTPLWWPAIILLAGCLVAPPAFWLGRALVHAGYVPQLAPFAFPTYLRRAWLVCAVATAPWWVPQLPRDWRPGARTWTLAARHAGLGLALGALPLATLVGTLFGAERLAWRPYADAAAFASSCSRAALAATLTAAAVAPLEEVLFRGLLWRTARRRLGPRVGGAVAVVLFAAVHFVAAPRHGPVAEDVAWYEGLRQLGLALRPFADPQAVWASFVSLGGVGLALQLAEARSGTLWLGMGLHAGWVLGLRFVGATTQTLAPPDWLLGSDLRAGAAPLTMLGLTAASLAYAPQARRWGR